MSRELCKYCGIIKGSDVHLPHTTDECSRTVATRQMKALESIAASLSTMIKEEYSRDPYIPPRIVGDGTGPDNWGRP